MRRTDVFKSGSGARFHSHKRPGLQPPSPTDECELSLPMPVDKFPIMSDDQNFHESQQAAASIAFPKNAQVT
jgi:hypothetical protein